MLLHKLNIFLSIITSSAFITHFESGKTFHDKYLFYDEVLFAISSECWVKKTRHELSLDFWDGVKIKRQQRRSQRTFECIWTCYHVSTIFIFTTYKPSTARIKIELVSRCAWLSAMFDFIFQFNSPQEHTLSVYLFIELSSRFAAAKQTQKPDRFRTAAVRLNLM